MIGCLCSIDPRPLLKFSNIASKPESFYDLSGDLIRRGHDTGDRLARAEKADDVSAFLGCIVVYEVADTQTHKFLADRL